MAAKNPWHDSTDIERSNIDILTPTFGFPQIISVATHILNNSSSFIDLIFTTPPNLVAESGVHSFLRANCHPPVTYVKLNLNVIYHLLVKEKYGTTK